MNPPSSVPPMNSENVLWTDPIVDEVRQAREHYTAAFDGDLQTLFQDLREQEKCSNRTFVSYPPRLISPAERVG